MFEGNNKVGIKSGKSVSSGMSISPSNQVCLSVHQMRYTGFNTSVVNLYNEISWLVVVLERNES